MRKFFMAITSDTGRPGQVPTYNGEHDHGMPSVLSAVSWGAIFAGAAAAAALSLILLMLGVGLGLSSVSPWSGEGISATALGVSTIAWIIVTQLMASGMGGYLAGRLRTRWTDTHIDEVYFRDTAHGFLAWALATLITAALLTSVVASIVGAGVQATATVAGGAASTAASAAVGAVSSGSTEGSQANSDADGPMGYLVDSLFRRSPTAAQDAGMTPGAPGTLSPPPFAPESSPQDGIEVARIFMNAGFTDPLPPEDVQHVGRLVAQRTGLSQQEAEERVTETYERAQTRLQEVETATREAADEARSASARSALWLFISLLAGAFVASLSATFGGRRRDA
jgi:hypothetical protein